MEGEDEEVVIVAVCPFCGSGERYLVLVDDFGDCEKYRCCECHAEFIDNLKSRQSTLFDW